MKKHLTPIQHAVTQEDATEPPFQNEYWDFDQEGIYVDIVSNEPLFTSLDKFHSECGWPAFSKPIMSDKITQKIDLSAGHKRIEIRSSEANSHLGHVFDDGPGPTGIRYCINSASLRFIAKEDLDKEGFSEFTNLFS